MSSIGWPTCTIKTANLSISIVKCVRRVDSLSLGRIFSPVIRTNVNEQHSSWHDIYLQINFNISTFSWKEASFNYILAKWTKEACTCFTRVLSHSSNCPEFISRTKESYRLLSRTVARGLLSVSISFTIGASRSSFSLPGRSCVFFSSLTHPLRSHSIQPSRSVVTARRLYKFYIIFMRHKVVEKPTEKKRERVRARAQGCGRGEAFRSKSPLSVPYRPRQSTL